MSDSSSLSPARVPQGRLARGTLAALRWGALGVVVLVALVYVRLLFGPIPLDFLSERVQSAVAGVVQNEFAVSWNRFGVSLDGPFNPVFRLESVELTERASGATIGTEALEIGVSPVGMLMGRPNARVTLDRPQFQIVQDLLGPRLSRLEQHNDPQTGETTIAVLEGERTAPVVRIQSDGLDLRMGESSQSSALRSDNAILVATVESINDGLAGLARQALAGQISRVSVRDGSAVVLDTVYGLYKEFDAVELEMRAGQSLGGVSARFSAEIAGHTTEGTIVRTRDGGVADVNFELDGLDFSTLLPFVDDPVGIAALKGRGGLSGAFRFAAPEGRVTRGAFTVDLAGTFLRVANDMFPVQTEPFDVAWYPQGARFHFADIAAAIGRSRAFISGDVALGFDARFGPTLAMDISAREVYLHPDDMDTRGAPLDRVDFEGWAAPLYGAVGVDRMVASADAASVVVSGRVDSLRAGLGVDLSVSGQGFDADAVKRIWPYVFAPEARAWLVDFVDGGVVKHADMRFDFPVGSIAVDGAPRPVPDGAMRIDMAAEGVDLARIGGMPEIEIAGETRVLVRDNQVTVGVDRAVVAGTEGPIMIENAAFLNQNTVAQRQTFELSGDISGPLPELLALADTSELTASGSVSEADMEALRAITGNADATVIATLRFDDIGQLEKVDYTANGVLSEVATVQPVGGFDVSETWLSFTASQAGFNVNGRGMLGEIPFDVSARQAGDAAPEIVVGSTFRAKDAAEFGVDLDEYLSGAVRLSGRPLPGGRFEVSADLTQARLALADIGVRKAAGVPGRANAVVAMGEEAGVSVSEADLAFGDVRLAGAFEISPEGALEEADFSTFQISPGDSARVAIVPGAGGYGLSVSGAQLDLRPMLRRFVSLESNSAAGASGELGDQRFSVDVDLDRAIGNYGTVALDVDLALTLEGDTLEYIDLSAGLGGERSISATTNTSDTDRVTSIAANDIGGLLRFVGLYPRLVGGEGSLVVRHDIASGVESGAFEMRNFSIVDEANIAQLLESGDAAQAYVAAGNSLDFARGRAEFIRTEDRVEVRDAALYGDSVGGTARGNILLDEGEYDLTGTYVPLFGINNAFQQIPLIGPIFGGREGEGLLGVTFAVRGPLAEPDLLVNPISILAPGVFRSLFEYRAQDGADT